MRHLELRIPLPFEVEKYQVGQNWSFNEQSKLETGGGEGVQGWDSPTISKQFLNLFLVNFPRVPFCRFKKLVFDF